MNAEAQPLQVRVKLVHLYAMFARPRKTLLNASAVIATTFVVSAIAEAFSSGATAISRADSLKNVVDDHGAIIRGDLSKKTLALVFTGDEFADGGNHIREVLLKHQVRGAFFLTGNFYANPAFDKLIRTLRRDGHYLGAHSDKHLLYADWIRRDSLLVTEQQFKDDLLRNYERMERFGIKSADAPYFLPPYEWYNATIAEWTRDLGLQLVNFSPGTRSAADYTFPGMGKRYLSSEEIYRSVVRYEEHDPHGLNGFMLLVHIGTDPRRTDKFYKHLDKLISELKSRGYRFVSINELLGTEGSAGTK